MSSFRQIARQYPYNSIARKPLLLQFILLRFFPAQLLPAMSLEPLMKHAYTLSSHLEFLVRYYISRIGFEQLWSSRERSTQKDIEQFYQEHDKDIWRQAYLSSENYEYKKKILRAYHLIRAEGISHDTPILDYGGGAGVLVHYLAKRGYTKVDIVDVPSQTLDFVRKEMSGLLRHIIGADGTESFPPNEYGAIVTLDCLEHTLNPLSIARRLMATLRPGGLLVINFPIETDFSHAHTKEAQIERPAVFAFLRESCEEVIPEYVYRKR